MRRAQRRVGKVQGVALSDGVLLFTEQGRASLPTWQAGNAEAPVDYLLRQVPNDAA